MASRKRTERAGLEQGTGMFLGSIGREVGCERERREKERDGKRGESERGLEGEERREMERERREERDGKRKSE